MITTEQQKIDYLIDHQPKILVPSVSGNGMGEDFKQPSPQPAMPSETKPAPQQPQEEAPLNDGVLIYEDSRLVHVGDQVAGTTMAQYTVKGWSAAKDEVYLKRGDKLWVTGSPDIFLMRFQQPQGGKCPHCFGLGFKLGGIKCRRCSGTGLAKKEEGE